MDSSAQRAFPALYCSLHPKQLIRQLLHPFPVLHQPPFSCILMLSCRNVKDLGLLFFINKEPKQSGKCQILQCLVLPPIVETIKI